MPKEEALFVSPRHHLYHKHHISTTAECKRNDRMPTRRILMALLLATMLAAQHSSAKAWKLEGKTTERKEKRDFDSEFSDGSSGLWTMVDVGSEPAPIFSREDRANDYRPLQFGKRGASDGNNFRPLQFGKRGSDFRPLQFGKRSSDFRPLQFGKRGALDGSRWPSGARELADIYGQPQFFAI